jgi:hypothetical protein
VEFTSFPSSLVLTHGPRFFSRFLDTGEAFTPQRKTGDVNLCIGENEKMIIHVKLAYMLTTYYRAPLHENGSTLLNQTTGGSLPSGRNLMTHPWNVFNHSFLIQWPSDKVEAQIVPSSASLPAKVNLSSAG